MNLNVKIHGYLWWAVVLKATQKTTWNTGKDFFVDDRMKIVSLLKTWINFDPRLD